MCAAESVFTNVTDSLFSIVIVEGVKQSGSHPGVEEPWALSTMLDDVVVEEGTTVNLR